MFIYHFGIFYGTNLLTRCPVPVPVFCCLFVSEKLVAELSRNQLQIYVNYLYMETKTVPGGDLQGGLIGPRRPQPRLGPTWETPRPPLVALSPINCPPPENPRYPIIFSRKVPRPPPSPTLDREGSEAIPGNLPEGEIVTGGIYTTMPAQAGHKT